MISGGEAMIQRFSWSFQVPLLAPFVTGGIVSSDAGVDSPLLRDEYGRLIISGYQISGYFRHFIMMVKAREEDKGIKESEALVPWDDFFGWFGLPGKQLRNPAEQSSKALELSGRQALDVNADLVRRGRLTFRDLAIEDPADEAQHISRIRIDKQRQSVAHGAWQVIEQFHAQDETKRYCLVLMAARRLCWLGAAKARGNSKNPSTFFSTGCKRWAETRRKGSGG